MSEEVTRVSVIGLGYVGLPLALRFAESGYEVVGIDVDETKIDQLKHGVSYLRDIGSARIEESVEEGKFTPSGNFSDLQSTEAVLICVPTPLDSYREPDLSFVEATAKSISEHLQKGMVVCLESTTYPGTSEEVLIPILENGSGLKAGEDFHVVYSPEREDPGNETHKIGDIPKLIGGFTDACRQRGVEVYERAVPHLVEMDTLKEAEAAKLLENIFRSVNIALVNELKIVFDQMGINIWEVIRGAKSKPFGFMPFYPGPGLGGHCIPIDPFYLTWKAREFGIHTRFIELAGEINTQMPRYVVDKAIRALNEKGIAVSRSKILVLGLAYKPDVSDDRESPSYRIIESLIDLGAEVDYQDPYIPVIGKSREFGHLAGMTSVGESLEEVELSDYDAVLIATAHSDYLAFDFAGIDSILVDTRNVIPNGNPETVRA